MLPYTTTKHAVVGLSLALRAEAAEHGVKVSVICPGFIDTPLLDNVNPGLPHTDISEHTRDIAIHVQRRLYPADHLARDVMRGLARDRAVIVAPATARVAWRLVRLAPGVAVRIMGFSSSRIRRTATDHRTRSA
jgi:short-subunit dehydrogenase